MKHFRNFHLSTWRKFELFSCKIIYFWNQFLIQFSISSNQGRFRTLHFHDPQSHVILWLINYEKSEKSLEILVIHSCNIKNFDALGDMQNLQVNFIRLNSNEPCIAEIWKFRRFGYGAIRLNAPVKVIIFWKRLKLKI